MYCSVCGSQLALGAAFCHKCGHAAGEPRKVVPLDDPEDYETRIALPEAPRKRLRGVRALTYVGVVLILAFGAIVIGVVIALIERSWPYLPGAHVSVSVPTSPTATPETTSTPKSDYSSGTSPTSPTPEQTPTESRKRPNNNGNMNVYDSGSDETTSGYVPTFSNHQPLFPARFAVQPGQYIWQSFTVPPSGGRIVGSYYSDSNIEAALFEAHNFESWRNGGYSRAIYSPGRIGRDPVNIPVGAGNYVFVFSNRYSVFSVKQITTDVSLEY